MKLPSLVSILPLFALLPPPSSLADEYRWNGQQCVNSQAEWGLNPVSISYGFSLPFFKAYGSEVSHERKVNRGFRRECSNLSGFIFSNQDFSSVTLSYSDFTSAHFRNMRFGYGDSGARLTGSNFSSATMLDSVFLASDLVGAWFNGALIVKSNFARTDLRGSHFNGASIRNLGLGGSKSPFGAANMKNADLTDADFTGADLTGANLSNAILLGAEFDSLTPTLYQAKSLFEAKINLRTRLPRGLSHKEAAKKYGMICVDCE